MEWLMMERWSPYVVGAAIGVLSWLTFLLSDSPLGASTSYARTAGMIEKLLRGQSILKKEYWQKYTPEVEWQWMLVFGAAVGGLISTALAGTFPFGWVPSNWAHAFGDGVSVRLVVAFVGGILMGIGSRWAGGCTSGHGISGTLQLVATSWIAVVCFFVGGIASAMFLFSVIGAA